MKAFWVWILVFFVGRAKPRGPVIPVGDPDVVVSLARTRAMLLRVTGGIYPYGSPV